MMIKVKTLILIVSLLVNALFAALVIGTFRSPASVSLLFAPPEQSFTAAMLVSVPFEAGIVVFNPVEITLLVGESASLQMASVIAGRQANWIIQALYNRDIISVSRNDSGITITAIAAGEDVIQTLGGEGITDIAIVRVIE
jgi:hypothetical protein